MNVPVPVAGSEDVHVPVAQRLAEVLLEQPVGAADDEVHHLVGRVHHAEAVGGAGVVSLVEILVDALEELLLLAVLGDVVGRAPDGRRSRPAAGPRRRGARCR